MYHLINSVVLIAASSTVCFQGAEIAQTALINVLSQLLNHFCAYEKVFYGLTCILISKNVNNGVSMQGFASI